MSMLRDLTVGANCEGVEGNPLAKLFDGLASYAQAAGASSASSAASASSASSSSSSSQIRRDLPVPELQRIHARASVLTRQLYPQESSAFIETHVASMLSSMGIDASRVAAATSMSSSSGFRYEEDTFDGHLDGPRSLVPVGAASSATQDESWEEVYARFLRENDVQNMEGSLLRVPEYQFVARSDNAFLGDPQAFDRGLALFKEGNMDAAIAAFEAALDASDAVDVSRSEIWQFLGVAHAECDNDMSAIAALSHAVQEDPSNLDALLELGVSYTNELDRLHALSILRSWFANHPDYAGLVEGTQQGEGSSTGSSLENEVSSLCDRALQMNPSDPDIHSLVGVLNAASGRHGEAVASFKEALKAHPRDYSLWNKIGATLANSSSSTDAIQAYRRALELKPRYARGWINMGISFSNVGDFPEAVRSYAQGLKIAPSASHVWDYLLIAFTCMGRTDLLDGCSAHDFSVLQEFL